MQKTEPLISTLRPYTYFIMIYIITAINNGFKCKAKAITPKADNIIITTIHPTTTFNLVSLLLALL